MGSEEDAIQALNTIYSVTRQVQLNAEQHGQLGKAYKVALDALQKTPVPENVVPLGDGIEEAAATE